MRYSFGLRHQRFTDEYCQATSNPFIIAITGAGRDRDFLALCAGRTPEGLRTASAELELFRRGSIVAVLMRATHRSESLEGGFIEA